MGAQGGRELVRVRDDREHQVEGRRPADRAARVAVLLQPAEQRGLVAEAVAAAERVDDRQPDRVGGRIPAQQRQRALRVRLDVLAELPGHAPEATDPTGACSRRRGAARPPGPRRGPRRVLDVVPLERQRAQDRPLGACRPALGRRQPPLREPGDRGASTPRGAGGPEHAAASVTPTSRGGQAFRAPRGAPRRPPAPPGGPRGRAPGPRPSEAHPPGDRAELRVALADDQRHRHRELAEAVPQRRHRAGAEPAQLGGVLGGAAAEPVGVRGGGDLRRLVREQRLRRPLARERLGPDRLDPPRERLVGRPPRRALAVVGHARAGRDEHEPPHPPGEPQRQREREPARPSSSRPA